MFVSVFVFFKQKTAYEMRISDWSSDVCSSDLRRRPRLLRPSAALRRGDGGDARHAAAGPRPPAGSGAMVTAAPHPLFDLRGGTALVRSEERRVGTECVGTCRSRGSP